MKQHTVLSLKRAPVNREEAAVKSEPRMSLLFSKDHSSPFLNIWKQWLKNCCCEINHLQQLPERQFKAKVISSPYLLLAKVQRFDAWTRPGCLLLTHVKPDTSSCFLKQPRHLFNVPAEDCTHHLNILAAQNICLPGSKVAEINSSHPPDSQYHSSGQQQSIP